MNAPHIFKSVICCVTILTNSDNLENIAVTKFPKSYYQMLLKCMNGPQSTCVFLISDLPQYLITSDSTRFIFKNGVIHKLQTPISTMSSANLKPHSNLSSIQTVSWHKHILTRELNAQLAEI